MYSATLYIYKSAIGHDLQKRWAQLKQEEEKRLSRNQQAIVNVEGYFWSDKNHEHKVFDALKTYTEEPKWYETTLIASNTRLNKQRNTVQTRTHLSALSSSTNSTSPLLWYVIVAFIVTEAHCVRTTTSMN